MPLPTSRRARGATAELPPLWWVGGRAAQESGGFPDPEIAFPPDGAKVELGMTGEAENALLLKVRNGPLTWLANGAPDQSQGIFQDTPPGAGRPGLCDPIGS